MVALEAGVQEYHGECSDFWLASPYSAAVPWRRFVIPPMFMVRMGFNSPETRPFPERRNPWRPLAG